ncbi:MAG: GH92 family glycosyl hydrolase [Dysgonamonadaceae bacterium]|jgi:predicted alpha-1,2-mannosidase|nr:GH92 family glycosyl hydrolase [Dysgonamonadaceae bacterium]
MKLKKAYFYCLFLLGITSLHANEAGSYAHKVNTLIGTSGVGWSSGYTWPGAVAPFGMVQFTTTYFTKQLGFVVNQTSGGGCDHQGNFPVLPLNGQLTVSPNNILDLRAGISGEKGIAGYYQATVNQTIQAELSATERTGMARFTYSGDEATVIIGGGVAATETTTAAIVITGKNSCEGYAVGGSFCGCPTPYKIYFVAEFDVECLDFGTWNGKNLHPNDRFSEGRNSGVYFHFDTKTKKTIQYKVGISYVSVANARLNLKAENTGWDFDAIKNKSIEAWNQALGKIEVSGANNDRTIQFYTHLYHALIHPSLCSDVNGEYMGADFQVHKTASKQYANFSNWDTYRGQTQLIAMLFPKETSDIVVSHYDFAVQSGGGFPRWVMANIETGIMQGDPSAIVVANAYAFGARNYDPRTILKVMEYGATNPAAKSQNEYTRPGLQQYMEQGFYNASIQLEYTSADFAIAQFALHACNNEPVSWYYMARAGSWKNLFNPETGWLQSRNVDGSWKPLSEDFRESTYKNYFWMVPYNIQGLMDMIGGKTAAEARLDDLFRRLDASYNDDWYASGNEPSWQIPWIYNWAGKPFKTQAIVRKILNEQYFSSANGLPGNDDLGTMGAWYVFACIGLYPEIPAVGGFAVNSPLFEKIILHLPKGDLKINGGSEENVYIQSLSINGQSYDQTWIDWEKIAQGGEISFKLGKKPNPVWGLKTSPPSFK